MKCLRVGRVLAGAIRVRGLARVMCVDVRVEGRLEALGTCTQEVHTREQEVH